MKIKYMTIRVEKVASPLTALQLDCVTYTMHLCAVFLKEQVVISDVFDSV